MVASQFGIGPWRDAIEPKPVAATLTRTSNAHDSVQWCIRLA